MPVMMLMIMVTKTPMKNSIERMDPSVVPPPSPAWSAAPRQCNPDVHSGALQRIRVLLLPQQRPHAPDDLLDAPRADLVLGASPGVDGDLHANASLS